VPFLVRVLRRIQTHVAQSATRIIVPSEYLKGIVSAWDMTNKNIHVIYNAVLTEGTGNVPKTVEHLSRPLVVTVGRLVPWKGIEGVIDAVALLRTKGIHASLAVIGDGPDRVALVARAEEKLTSDYLFTGTLSHADTLAVMQSAEAFVLNSTYEGLAHILIEALTLDVPIVATRVGGNPEVITHKENGLLVESGDTPKLAGALEHALTDTRLRAHLFKCALESAKRFSADTMLDTFAATVHKL